jgi:hypothetical protein
MEEFPTLDGDKPLQGGIDSVYYSYNDTTVYFFKGEDVWKNELFHPRQKQIRNGIKYVGKWYEHCKVDMHNVDRNKTCYFWNDRDIKHYLSHVT